MSWFGRDFAALCSDDRHCTSESTELDVEVEDGVVVERRSVLWLSAGAVAAALVAASPLAAQGKDKDKSKEKGKDKGKEQKRATGGVRGKLTFDEFLAEVYPIAKRLIESKGEDEEAYLMTVAAALSRVAEPDGEIRAAMQAFRKKHAEDGVRFPLAAMSMRLQAGRGFTHHDHRDYNGVILGVSGECRIRNYDILGGNQIPAEGKTFQIRETRDDLILPGRFSTLGRGRENVHDLVAGKDGARVLDVFTFFERGATSKYLDVEKKPRDEEARIYNASWRASRRRRGRGKERRRR